MAAGIGCRSAVITSIVRKLARAIVQKNAETNMTLKLYAVLKYKPPHEPVLGACVFKRDGNKKQCTAAAKNYIKANLNLGNLVWKWE
jgi:hypothetical protein